MSRRSQVLPRLAEEPAADEQAALIRAFLAPLWRCVYCRGTRKSVGSRITATRSIGVPPVRPPIPVAREFLGSRLL